MTNCDNTFAPFSYLWWRKANCERAIVGMTTAKCAGANESQEFDVSHITFARWCWCSSRCFENQFNLKITNTLLGSIELLHITHHFSFHMSPHPPTKLLKDETKIETWKQRRNMKIFIYKFSRFCFNSHLATYNIIHVTSAKKNHQRYPCTSSERARDAKLN